MLTILHISDLHFRPPFVPAAGNALLRVAPTLEADVIVVSGDLSQRAKRYQFEKARDILSRLPKVPMIVIPGNHDAPLHRIVERLLKPHHLYREIIPPELNPILPPRNQEESQLWCGAAFAGFIMALAGYFGDINISAMKRDRGVKDGSNMLPGMGGLIDRVDSLTVSAPAFVFFQLWRMN